MLKYGESRIGLELIMVKEGERRIGLELHINGKGW
jgi:hypothetical protein